VYARVSVSTDIAERIPEFRPAFFVLEKGHVKLQIFFSLFSGL